MFEVRHVRVRRVALALLLLLLLLRMRFVGGYAIVCTYRTSPYGSGKR